MKSITVKILLASAALLLAVAAPAQNLKKSVTWEKIQANPAPLPVVGKLVPAPSTLDKNSFWSVGSETLDRDYADFEKYRMYMKETGVGYARLQSGWAKTEQKKGKYDFSWIDAHVDGLIAEGINPWMCLCYGNPIYSDHGLNLGAGIFGDGPAMDAWLRYVKACVKRWKGKVTMWEVWNEPDGGKGSAAEYANLFVRTAKAIRQVDPNAKIASFGACSPDRAYIRESMKHIAAADGVKYMDYMTYHAYWPIPEDIVPSVFELKKEMEAYSPSIKLLQGETGCPGQLEHGHALKGYEWNEYSQAKWDLRQSLTHFGIGVPYSFFTMVDLNYGWMLQTFGLIRMNGIKEPVYKRPKFYAVQNITSVFTPEMKAVEDVKVAGPENIKMASYGLQKNGQNVGCMFWFSGNRPSATLERLPVDITVTGMKFENPVYVDMLTGNVHDLKGVETVVNGESTCFKGVPVWDSPILIIEKSAVNVK